MVHGRRHQRPHQQHSTQLLACAPKKLRCTMQSRPPSSAWPPSFMPAGGASRLAARVNLAPSWQCTAVPCCCPPGNSNQASSRSHQARARGAVAGQQQSSQLVNQASQLGKQARTRCTVSQEDKAGAGAPDGPLLRHKLPQLRDESPALRHQRHGRALAAWLKGRRAGRQHGAAALASRQRRQGMRGECERACPCRRQDASLQV